MPFYEWGCEKCSVEGEFFAHIDDRNITPRCDVCGGGTSRVISATPGIVKFPAAGGHEYRSPVSGKPITTERARRDDLARTNSRPYEGFEQEKKEAQRRVKADEKKSDAKLDESVRRAYHQLTPTKRRHLGG